MLACPMNHAVLPPSLPADASGRRVVLDTQIVMDWLVFSEPRVMPIITLVESRHLLWTATAPMKAEMLHVLGRGVAARYSPDLEKIHAAFEQHCELVAEPQLGMARPRCSDEDDQKFIDLALHLASQGSALLISRDRAVLKVAKRAARLGLEILAPEVWIKRQTLAAQ